MMNFTYYRSGDWKVTCDVCGAEHLFASIAQAYAEGIRHTRRCRA